MMIILHGSVLLASLIHSSGREFKTHKMQFGCNLEYVTPIYRDFNSCSYSSISPHQEIKTLEHKGAKVQ